MKLFLGVVIASALCGSAAIAAPSGKQICSRMIAEDRGNGMSVQDCTCMYRVADAVLDPDLKALLFESWYTGKNNMAALQTLPNPRRLDKQMRKMQRTLRKNCPNTQ